MNATHYRHEELKRLRNAQRRSVIEVAEALGKERMSIYRAENGTSVSYELLCDLARYYEVPVVSLLYPVPQVSSQKIFA